MISIAPSDLAFRTPRHSRGVLALLTYSILAACAGADPYPPANLPPPVLLGTPSDSLEVVDEGPPSDPELTLEQRWREPFAVVSTGRPPPRPARPAVVIIGQEPPVAEPSVVTATDPEEAPQRATTPAARQPAASAPAERPRQPASAPASTAGRPGSASASSTRTHRVEWGETWYGIARRYSVSPAALAAANPDIEPNRIRSGQVLRLPRAGGAASSGSQRTHTVGPGDTLWGIARRYGLTPEEIRAANKMQDDRVRLGQSLIIPGSENSR